MDYEESLRYIHSFQRFGTHPGLHRINAVLEELGHPEKAGTRFVHIAGTNGKGSVTAMVDSVLRTAGYRCGRYISPYLERFNERVSFAGQDISDDELAAVTTEVAGAIERAQAKGAEPPVEFDVITAIAFAWYAARGAEYVALEAGLGGTYDSTNVVNPMVSVITSIGRDHLAVLGPTLADVASNKAGIIKPGRPAIVHCADEAAMRVIAAEAAAKGSQLTVIGRDVTWQGQPLGLDDGNPATAPLGAQRVTVTGPGWSLADIIVPLSGPHQQINAATAVAALKQLVADGVKITDDDIRRGIAATTWPGRLEVMGRQPLVIIDGAHNPEAAVALAAAVRPIGRRRTILVLGMLADKELAPVLDSLLPLADEVIVTTPNSLRAGAPETITAQVSARGVVARTIPAVAEAVRTALAAATSDDLVLITGSLYLIGEVRPLLRDLLR